MSIVAAPIDFNHELVHGTAARCIRGALKRLLLLGHLHPNDVDDYEQELRLHVFQQAAHFDPEKSSWGTFVRVVVRSKCTTLQRVTCRHASSSDRAFSLSEAERNFVDSLSGQLCGYESAGTSYEPTSELERELDCDALIASLPVKLRRFAQQLKSKSIWQIARERNVSPWGLYKQVNKIREHFQSLAPAA
jgi:DNA-directed RNA polymerase specialized sigma24 family protein